jgi:hypothetical protein
MSKEIEWLDKVRHNFSQEQFNIDEDKYRSIEFNQDSDYGSGNFSSGVSISAILNSTNPFLESSRAYEDNQPGVLYPDPISLSSNDYVTAVIPDTQATYTNLQVISGTSGETLVRSLNGQPVSYYLSNGNVFTTTSIYWVPVPR